MRSFERESDEQAEAPAEPPLTDEEERDRRKHTRKEKWQTAAGVYISVKPPNWAATNSRRL